MKQIGGSARGDPDAAFWDIASLDTAKNINTLSPLEKDVILEMNKARNDPRKYAQLYIRPRLTKFRGKDFCMPNGAMLMTEEGEAAVHDCLSALARTETAGLLSPVKGLWQAARDHAADQGATGGTGHIGSDNSTFQTRIMRHGTFSGRLCRCGENISYGPDTGREIVCCMLIDDGVPGRGHRSNLLLKDFTQTAASCGSHPGFGVVCVITFAAGFRNKDV
jgi:hypothetical protein